MLLSIAGDHVPVMPFVDVVGKGLKVPPAHIGVTALKEGITGVFTTTTLLVVILAHCPPDGVNV